MIDTYYAVVRILNVRLDNIYCPTSMRCAVYLMCNTSVISASMFKYPSI